MSANSKIEWTDHTFNPWEGCQKVGPGCDNCYAEARNARFGGGTAPNWGTDAPRRRTSPHNWELPLRWNREAVRTGIRPRVFCASLADVFDKDVPQTWRTDLWDLVEATPGLDWLLLTKRIGNAERMLPKAWLQQPRPNVWLGATIVNQREAERDIPKLLDTPAAKRFLSMEPLLGPVDLTRLPYDGDGAGDALGGEIWVEQWLDDDGKQRRRYPVGDFGRVDWVIVGGESGSGARPMSPDWARSLRDQCQAAGVPFLFKQWGEWLPMLGQVAGVPVREKVTMPDGWVMGHAGKKAAGRLLDGREWNEVPTC